MNFDLLIDLHKRNKRQGPGGEAETLQALHLSGMMDKDGPLRIADIGCGTGASTLLLAEHLNAEIIAVDLFQDFLDILSSDALTRGLSEKITTKALPMTELTFEEESLDMIWAEGSIYNMGFEAGVDYFKRFLKPGGILAVSEITWVNKDLPSELYQHWTSEYPEIGFASEKIGILENHGYVVKGYFPLPEKCWYENYYSPLENSYDAFEKRHNSEEAKQIVIAEKAEIALYQKYSAFYSYGFYIAAKV